MSFFKTFLACLLALVVGSIISTIFSIIIFFGMIAALASSNSEIVNVSPNSILHIDLNKPIREIKPENPFEEFDFNNFTISSSLTTLEAVNAIKDAADDPNIKGIYLDMPLAPMISTNGLYELREAIKYFKESSGKFVVAYGDYYSQGTYWLAATSDKIYINPQGGLAWTGLASEMMFYKNTLNKLGIEPEIFRHGKFKSAVEPFMLDKMSDENREQMNSLLGSLWGALVSDIANERSIDSILLQQYASNLTINSPRVASELGFVDSLCYRDHVNNYLKELTSVTDDKKEASLIELSRYASTTGVKNASASDQVAVLYASGDIIDVNDGGPAIVGNKLREDIESLRKNKKVKAVVIRVNSPGGSVLASDIIHHEVELLKAEKPVVISMGDYAASGGYYISCPADEIIAAPTTLTGSIGVFGLWFNAQKGASEILGINVDVVKTNESADIGSMFRPMTPVQRMFMQNGVDSTYNRFVNLVATGRNMTFAEVDSIAGGRVWSGNQAVALKLVDRTGTIDDAIDAAAMKAGIDSYRVSTYPKADMDSFKAIFANSLSSAANYVFSDHSAEAQVKKQLEQLKSKQGLVARMPFDITVIE